MGREILQRGKGRGGKLAGRAHLRCKGIEFALGGQLAVPEKIGDLFKGHLAGKLADVIAAKR
jgi:hypothetical protein